MESELWLSMEELHLTTLPIIAVDEDGNFIFCHRGIGSNEIKDLKNDGYIKWCYVSDLVQAAYNM